MATMTPELAFKLHLAHREADPYLVCSVTRTCDGVHYAYFARRVGNELVGNYVECKLLECGKWDKLEAPDPVLLESFYGIHVKPIPNTKKYTATINAFPDREMTLIMKKAPKSDSKETRDHPGFTNAYGTLQLSSGHKVENAQVHTFFNDLVMPDFGTPDLRAVTVFAVTSSEAIAHLPKDIRDRHCKPFADDPSSWYVTETIVVTEELRKRFNVFDLTKRFLQNVAK